MSSEINYEDERFAQVEQQKDQAISDIEKTYSGMIDQTDALYQDQIDAAKQWEQQQSKLQQEQTDFAIEQIEQQKQQAQKDYTKEQSGAFVDYQKESNRYGANAEQIAAGGLGGSGYAETSQVGMYNTYQNRVATARESYLRAVQNYDNAITEARLQNNSALAQIAYEALQQQLVLSLEGFQYKNNLLLEQTNKKLEVDNHYYNRYQNVLAQINQERALAEQIRQFNENKALAEKEYEEGVRQYNEAMELQKQQYADEQRKDAFEKALAQYELLGYVTPELSEILGIPVTEAPTSSGGGYSGSKKSAEDASKKLNSAVKPTKKTTEQSVLDLGYGPINGEYLAELVVAGKVEQYQDENGTTLFRNTNESGAYLPGVVEAVNDNAANKKTYWNWLG